MSLPNKQISHPPIEFPVVKKDGTISTEFMDWMNSIKPTLENTVTNQYISTPHLASQNIVNITKPQSGMEIYDTDSNKRRVNENGTWKYYNTSTSQFANSTPRITTAQRDAIQNPEDGYWIYNTDLKKFQGYEDGAWKTMTSS